MNQHTINQILHVLTDIKDEQKKFSGDLQEVKNEQKIFTSELKGFKTEQEKFSKDLQEVKREQREFSKEQKSFSGQLKEFKHEQENTTKELQGVKHEQSTLRQDMNAGFDRLEKKLDSHHIENINADNLLLNEIRKVRGDVVFVNRKVADTELDIHTLKQKR